MKQFYKIILTIILFIISSVFPFYFVSYYSGTYTFTAIYIFSIWVAFISLLLSYVIEDKWKLLFVIFFWAIFFIFSFGTDLFGVKLIDPLLYGLVYSAFFLMCGSILHKWKLELHERVQLVIFGYLFQGVYDWIWWIIQYYDPSKNPFGGWGDLFYVDIIIKNSTLFSVLIVEIINLILALIIIILYPRKNWDFLVGCFDWLLLQLFTLALSWSGINFPYIILYILISISFILYLLLKYKKEEVIEFIKKIYGWIKSLFYRLKH